MRVLLVEDDPMIGESVGKGLRSEGLTVDWVQDGRRAELALENAVYSLVLLDLGLPRKDGLELLQDLRRRGHSLPVLIITARTRYRTGCVASTAAPTTTWSSPST